jgi:acetyltransferase-like isoleucine patch superfamily enzyme
MKDWLIKAVLHLIHSFLLNYYKCKCTINFYLYGGEGVGYVIERLPRIYLISILKRYGCAVGQNCRIQTGIIFHNLDGKLPLRNLTLGDNVYIGSHVLLDLADRIELMDYSMLGAGCQLWTHFGDFSYDSSDYHETKNPIKIGKGVLVWSGVIINPGVSIGDYTRVGAGSVVLKDLDSKMFYAGVPAQKIAERNI